MAIGRFPHCDQRILHKGDCQYCDAHPEWQELREAWGIAFTGQEPAEGQLPCPADARRPAGAENDHRRWAGNVATSAKPVNETAASRMLYGPPVDKATFAKQAASVLGRIRGPRKDRHQTRPVTGVGSGLTTDRFDSRLGHGIDEEPVGQNEVYLVLSQEERAKGFVRPVRRSYRHVTCGSITTMGLALAETTARDPLFYKGTFCATCSMHRPTGPNGEFEWLDGSKVGT